MSRRGRPFVTGEVDPRKTPPWLVKRAAMSSPPSIRYRAGNDLDLDMVIDVYRDSTLGLRRPVDERDRMKQMLETANLVISAWEGDRMVGISRSLSDFCYCTYLSDLAVRVSHQRRGIGRELMRRTKEAGGRATVFLFAAPAAEAYYPRVGFRAGSGWILGEADALR